MHRLASLVGVVVVTAPAVAQAPLDWSTAAASNDPYAWVRANWQARNRPLTPQPAAVGPAVSAVGWATPAAGWASGTMTGISSGTVTPTGWAATAPPTTAAIVSRPVQPAATPAATQTASGWNSRPTTPTGQHVPALCMCSGCTGFVPPSNAGPTTGGSGGGPTRSGGPEQIPQLNSRPGAAYTLFLNFGGFTFVGGWGGDPQFSPGVTPSYTIDGDASNFSAQEIANIRNVWSRVAEKFVALNVNVTTVDPATAGLTAAQRQAFYEQQPRLMHTVIGGNGSWIGGGGYSYIGTTAGTYDPSGINGGAGAGYKTNWAFSAQAANNLQFVAEVTTHENGHGLGLNHQSRYVGGGFVSEYDTGTGTGVGSVAPIMGDSYSAQRGLWRVGDYVTARDANGNPTARGTQNDLTILRANPGIGGSGAGGFMDSGIGHTLATATVLPTAGGAITSSAKGFIAPNSATPNPIGIGNYTTDFFTFTVPTGYTATVNVTLRSGTSTLTAGVADPGATLNATLRLLNGSGTAIATANNGVLAETITQSSLPADTYYLEITSAGGTTDARGYTYFDTGSYFLTGTVVAPEPTGLLAVLVVAGLGVRRWRRAA